MNADLLICLVAKRRPLWDKKDPQHHNRFVLDAKWDEIAFEMGASRNIVRNKWKTLRDGFRKEFLKINTTGYEEVDSPFHLKPKWKYYDCLMFLKDQFHPRWSGGNLPQLTVDLLDSDEKTNDALLIDDPEFKSNIALATSSSNILTRTQKRKQSSDEMDENDLVSNDEMGNKLVKIEEFNVGEMHQPQSPTISNQDNTDDMTRGSIATIDPAKIIKPEFITPKRSRSSDEPANEFSEKNETKFSITPDDDEAFFSSLLPFMRPLPQADKLLLRIQIQQLIYDFIK